MSLGAASQHRARHQDTYPSFLKHCGPWARGPGDLGTVIHSVSKRLSSPYSPSLTQAPTGSHLQRPFQALESPVLKAFLCEKREGWV